MNPVMSTGGAALRARIAQLDLADSGARRAEAEERREGDEPVRDDDAERRPGRRPECGEADSLVACGPGVERIADEVPDLMVLDLRLPDIDGLDVIRSLRKESNLPVVMLTARAEESDKIAGLELGADDYITKPFNFEVLNAKIKNLLLLNSTLKTTYTKQIKVLTPEIEIESDDEKLLKQIMLYLEENLTNPQLSVEELSKHVGMSRSSLYSKLLEVTGQTPVEYIRSVKTIYV